MCNAEYVVLWQYDDLPSTDRDWLDDVLDTFSLDPKIGLIGMRKGSRVNWTASVESPTHNERYDRLAYADRKYVTLPDRAHTAMYMYCAWVNLSPFILKKDYFLNCGMFPYWCSPVGQNSVGLGRALSYAMRDSRYRTVFLSTDKDASYLQSHGIQMSMENREKKNQFYMNKKNNMEQLERMYGKQFEAMEGKIAALNNISGEDVYIETKGVGKDSWGGESVVISIPRRRTYAAAAFILEFPEFEQNGERKLTFCLPGLKQVEFVPSPKELSIEHTYKKF